MISTTQSTKSSKSRGEEKQNKFSCVTLHHGLVFVFGRQFEAHETALVEFLRGFPTHDGGAGPSANLGFPGSGRECDCLTLHDGLVFVVGGRFERHETALAQFLGGFPAQDGGADRSANFGWPRNCPECDY